MLPMLWAWSDFGRRARACHVHTNSGSAMSDAQMLQRSLRFSFAFSHCFWTLVLASAPTSCLPCVFPPQYAVLVMGCLALAARLVQWLAPWSLSPSARVLSTKLDQVLCILCHFQEHSWFWSRENGHFCTVDPCWSTGPIVIANTFSSCSPFVMCQQSWPTSQPELLWANPIRHFYAGPLGVPGVLWLQCIICVLGAAVSTAYLKHDWEYESVDGRSFRNQPGSFEAAWPVLID